MMLRMKAEHLMHAAHMNGLGNHHSVVRIMHMPLRLIMHMLCSKHVLHCVRIFFLAVCIVIVVAYLLNLRINKLKLITQWKCTMEMN